MRCKACGRTITPSQTKDFYNFSFCKTCYDALELKDVEKKELHGYFLSLSTETTANVVEALVTIASKFHSQEGDIFLKECIYAVGHDILHPRDILTFLLAAKAVQESQGSESLTTAGKLALFGLSSRLAYEVLDMGYEELPPDEELSEYDVLKKGSAQVKKDYNVCSAVLDTMEPSVYTEALRRHLEGLQLMFALMPLTEEVNLSTVEEGVWIKIREETEELLRDELGSEHVFHRWDELKDTLEDFNKDLLDNGTYLDIAEEEYHGEIYLLVDSRGLFITSQWEQIKNVIPSQDFDRFIASLGEVPLFVYERAAGGKEPFRHFMEAALSAYPENTELPSLYAYLLNEEDPHEAVDFLEEKVSDTPDPELFMQLADLLNETGQPERALSTYKKAAEMDPEDVNIPMFMGQIYETMGKLQNAEACYHKALAMNPDSPFLLSLVSRIRTRAALDDINELISQEEYEEALKIIDKYFDPFDVTVFHYHKGIALSRMGRPREALPLLTDYLDLYEDDEEGWLEKAGIYLELGQYAAAARCFKRCSMLNPYSIEPLVWEAICHKKLGRSRFYKRCINAAKKIDPEGTKALLKELKFL